MVKIVLTDAGKEWMKENYPQGIVFEYNLSDEFEIRSLGSDDVEATCPMGIPYRFPHTVDGKKIWKKW